MNDVLRWLTRPPPALDGPTLEAWWPGQWQRTAAMPAPIDRAFAGGALADRLGYAFAAGYQAALTALFGPPHSEGAIASLCATEEGGSHPKVLTTTVERRGDTLVVNGTKTWATMAPIARTLYVVAVAGEGEGGRRRLQIVRVPAAAAGLTLEARPPVPMAPEVTHAFLRLEGVALPLEAGLEGDGYERYVKPFRTVEDVHVLAAAVGYLAAAGARRAWPEPLREGLLGLALSLRGLAALDPSAPETHLALAGSVALTRRLCDECDAAWQAAPDDEAARWQRDRVLLNVANSARQKRRESAWRALSVRT
ncbi:MAG: acyl-CoA dehydrogenase family protein [Polyangiaceae bacterium]|nr:acyl-CoA dehydrogenase family protein [Polyangiaceae bacterium]